MQKTVRVPGKSRGAFMTCFLLGLLLVLLAAAYSLYANATKAEVFEAALREADINELLDIVLGDASLSASLAKGFDLSELIPDPEVLSGFTQHTIDYLTGKVEEWKPSITVFGFEAPIPVSGEFLSHMDDVKGWVEIGQKAFVALLAVCGVLLLRVLISSRRGRSGFSGAGYLIGVMLPLALVGGIIGWAFFDFDGFWLFLHEHFIKDGIFSSGEAIMQIFTTDMFKAFMQPIVTTFALLLGGIVLLPVVVAPLCNLLRGGSKD